MGKVKVKGGVRVKEIGGLKIVRESHKVRESLALTFNYFFYASFEFSENFQTDRK